MRHAELFVGGEGTHARTDETHFRRQVAWRSPGCLFPSLDKLLVRNDICRFVPPQARETPCPVVWYLSGLTCTHANVMDKGEYRRTAAELGLIVVCPDTSPRGADIPDEKDNWQFGLGAGFYRRCDARALCEELPHVLLHHRGTAGPDRAGISGRYGAPGYLWPFDGRPWRADDCLEKSRALQELLGVCADRAAKHRWLVEPAFEKYLGTDEASGGPTTPPRSSRMGTVSPNFSSTRAHRTDFSRMGCGPGCWRTPAPKPAFR